jgi:hypothetical protein
MTEIERIEDQIKRAYGGRAWHGPSLKESLAGVTAIQASGRHLANSHTIWEIVNHLAAWTGVVIQRLRGQPLVEPAEGDFPGHAFPGHDLREHDLPEHDLPGHDLPGHGNADEAAWLAALAVLERNHEALLMEIAAMDDSSLDEACAGHSVSRYAHLHGTVQHYCYHAGQIALLKKM